MNELFGYYEAQEGWENWQSDPRDEAAMLSDLGSSFTNNDYGSFGSPWTGDQSASQAVDGSDFDRGALPNHNLYSGSLFAQHEAVRSFEGTWSNAVIGSIPSHRTTMSNSSTTSMEARLSTHDMRTPEPQNRLLSPVNPAWNYVVHQPVISQGAARANVYMRTNSPPPICTKGSTPVQKHLRSEDDEYTASWTCGTGNERAGWCRLCHSWHKLKNSAYWYHMHYVHGISCVTGKRFAKPLDFVNQGSAGCQVLCGGCNQWVSVGRADRWETPYFRHAYKCQIKNNPALTRARSRTQSTSPRRATTSKQQHQ